MARHHHAVLLCVLLCGCVGPNLPAPELSGRVNARPDDVLSAAGEAFLARGYSPFFGNVGIVVASKSEDTVWTVPATVAGVLALPFFLVTWPVVSILDTTPHKELTMWWPFRAFAWATHTSKDSIIYLSAGAEGDGSRVRVRVQSPEEIPQRDGAAVLDALKDRFGEASSGVESTGLAKRDHCDGDTHTGHAKP
jgi:hypothetical protein